MSKFKPYEQVKVVGLKKLSGEGDRFDALGWFIKEEIVGPNKGRYKVRIGSTEITVPKEKVRKLNG